MEASVDPTTAQSGRSGQYQGLMPMMANGAAPAAQYSNPASSASEHLDAGCPEMFQEPLEQTQFYSAPQYVHPMSAEQYQPTLERYAFPESFCSQVSPLQPQRTQRPAEQPYQQQYESQQTQTYEPQQQMQLQQQDYAALSGPEYRELPHSAQGPPQQALQPAATTQPTLLQQLVPEGQGAGSQQQSGSIAGEHLGHPAPGGATEPRQGGARQLPAPRHASADGEDAIQEVETLPCELEASQGFPSSSQPESAAPHVESGAAVADGAPQSSPAPDASIQSGASSAGGQLTGKKRGRPKGSRNRKTLEREGLLPPPPPPAALPSSAHSDIQLNPPLKKRGRPPGSKNRKTLEKERQRQQQQAHGLAASLPGALGSAPLPTGSVLQQLHPGPTPQQQGGVWPQQESLTSLLTGQDSVPQGQKASSEPDMRTGTDPEPASHKAMLERFGPDILARYPELIGKFKVPGRKPGRPPGSKTINRRTKEEREARARARLLPSGKKRGRPPGRKTTAKSTDGQQGAADGHTAPQPGPSEGTDAQVNGGTPQGQPFPATSSAPALLPPFAIPHPSTKGASGPSGNGSSDMTSQVAIGVPAPAVEGHTVDHEDQQQPELQAAEQEPVQQSVPASQTQGGLETHEGRNLDEAQGLSVAKASAAKASADGYVAHLGVAALEPPLGQQIAMQQQEPPETVSSGPLTAADMQSLY